MRRRIALLLGVGGLLLAANAQAMSLSDAIALAQKTNPTLAERRADADGARARITQANAGRLPTVALTGQIGTGSADLGGFFGFGRSTIHPEGAAIEVRQPLFAGGAITAAIDRARAAREAALQDVGAAQALLATQVAEAYVAVLNAREMVQVTEADQAQVQTFVDQARLRFKAGEIPRTDLSAAEARLAEIQAAQAQAQGDVVKAEAQFQSVVGAPPDGLEQPDPPAVDFATLEDASTAAERSSPAVLSAQANVRAADAGIREAAGARLPTVGLAASAGTTRDQFFPGYRNDGYTVGVVARWTLFSGGLVSGRVDEARATQRAAQAALDAARAQLRNAVVGAWEDVTVSRSLVKAASDQAAAAASAVDSATQEVRVGQKPMLDLLTIERESLAARSDLIAARGNAVVAAYRLNGLVGQTP